MNREIKYRLRLVVFKLWGHCNRLGDNDTVTSVESRSSPSTDLDEVTVSVLASGGAMAPNAVVAGKL